MTLGPAVRDGEHVFGVARIFASFNDTFIVSNMQLLLLLFSFVDFFSSLNWNFLKSGCD